MHTYLGGISSSSSWESSMDTTLAAEELDPTLTAEELAVARGVGARIWAQRRCKALKPLTLHAVTRTLP